MNPLYEGKAKIVYPDSDHTYRVYFKDDATAFNGQKRAELEDKGSLNARISAILFGVVERAGIPTHFLESLSQREHRVRRLSMIPLEVVVRNVVAGSLSQRLGLAEGETLRLPVVELYLKNDALGDPLVNHFHIRALGIAEEPLVGTLESLGLRVNEALTAYLLPRGLRLIDFKLEFGSDREGRILLGDEISPDTCRFWDVETGMRLDKDRFRRDLGGVLDAYREVLRRVEDHG